MGIEIFILDKNGIRDHVDDERFQNTDSLKGNEKNFVFGVEAFLNLWSGLHTEP